MANGGSGPGGIGSGGGSVTPIGDVINAFGTSGDIGAPVFSVSQPNGIVGIGSIKNSGANGLTVTETVTDKFGHTVSVTTSVPSGDTYTLNPDVNFVSGGVTALPPFTAYSVTVQSTVPGNPTTYELHYVDVAPGSGPGTGGGPPGAWTEVAKGQTSVGPGATVTLASAPLPGGGTAVYVPFLTFDAPGGSPLALFQGNTLATPPANSIVYSLNFVGGNVALVVSSSAMAPPVTMNWVLYKVVP